DENGKVIGIREDFIGFVDPRWVLDNQNNNAQDVTSDNDRSSSDEGDFSDGEDLLAPDEVVENGSDGENNADDDDEQALTGEKLGKITVEHLIIG
ncbi:hypothetical protein DD577_28990, partial [Klebsiella pneumoniae]|uniref:hypothetical protein n=1 Tax=Klebsiella pneumoniae TaxID=573 RepID=UPI00102648A0